MTLDDIIEEICNIACIYEGNSYMDSEKKLIIHPENCGCRAHFESELKERIMNAVLREKEK